MPHPFRGTSIATKRGTACVSARHWRVAVFGSGDEHFQECSNHAPHQCIQKIQSCNANPLDTCRKNANTSKFSAIQPSSGTPVHREGDLYTEKQTDTRKYRIPNLKNRMLCKRHVPANGRCPSEQFFFALNAEMRRDARVCQLV